MKLKLRFSNWIHYMNAARFLYVRHKEFEYKDREMSLIFFSEENLDEMKEQFDILGWKSEKLDK